MSDKKEYIDYEKTIESLRNVSKEYYNGITCGDIDKKNIGFSTRDDWSVYSVKLYFTNYKGRYGSSSCGTFVYLGDNKLVTHGLIKWLNNNYQMVFNGVADILEKESDKARLKEISELRARLKEIGGLEEDDV